MIVDLRTALDYGQAQCKTQLKNEACWDKMGSTSKQSFDSIQQKMPTCFGVMFSMGLAQCFLSF